MAERISDVLEVALEKEVTDPVKTYNIPEVDAGSSNENSNEPLIAKED